MKIRFLEPGNRPYRKSLLNLFVYERYIRAPSNGMLILAGIARRKFDDVFCYSESISKVVWEDALDADVVCISAFSFAAPRAYEMAARLHAESNAIVVMGGLHATLAPEEAASHCDYVLRGEGDESMLPLLECLERGEDPVGKVPGAVAMRDGELVGLPSEIPHAIDNAPDYSLLYRYHEMVGHNTIWPQVHASRGCPHNCSYCGLVAAFGRKVRTRPPESVVAEIRHAIDFFDKGNHRLAKMLWITDDNFFANRDWAISVLKAIIESDINYNFTIQARYEVGFDDEMLDLLREAGFSELAMGIEFLDDESFEAYGKKSTRHEIERSIANIQAHGLRVRGLFIVGTENHGPGVGDKLADFVISHDIQGILVQSMYFIPGTGSYDEHKDVLLEQARWDRCVGSVVHHPSQMSAAQLQEEIIHASKRVYSLPRLASALVHKRGLERLLFVGEFFWQASRRHDLRKELPYLRRMDAKLQQSAASSKDPASGIRLQQGAARSEHPYGDSPTRRVEPACSRANGEAHSPVGHLAATPPVVQEVLR